MALCRERPAWGRKETAMQEVRFSKVVLDALNGVAYHDDAQVMYTAAKKAYSAIEGLDVTVEEYTG